MATEQTRAKLRRFICLRPRIPDTRIFLRQHLPHFRHAQPLSTEFAVRLRRALPRGLRLLQKFFETVSHPCFSVVITSHPETRNRRNGDLLFL
jgi:hypothetical protein